MPSALPRKAYQIVAVLLVCLAVGATLACQIHLAPSDHDHGTPDTHHSGSTSHTRLDFSCVVAVLPVMIIVFSWFSGALPATPQVLKHTVSVLPPFIPPRPPALF